MGTGDIKYETTHFRRPRKTRTTPIPLQLRRGALLKARSEWLRVVRSGDWLMNLRHADEGRTSGDEAMRARTTHQYSHPRFSSTFAAAVTASQLDHNNGMRQVAREHSFYKLLSATKDFLWTTRGNSLFLPIV